MILSQKFSLTHAYIRKGQHILPFNLVPEAEMEQGKTRPHFVAFNIY